MAKIKFKKVPFDRIGRSLFSFLLAELISIWIVGIMSLILLPTIIPLHFGWNGAASSYGFSSILLIIALIFSVVPGIILVVSYYRFKLLNKYPYLVNIPFFYASIKNISSARKGYWVNQYFNALMVGGVYISCILLVLILEVYAAAQKDYINGVLAIIIPVIAIVAVAVLMLILIKDMYRKMEKEITKKQKRRR